MLLRNYQISILLFTFWLVVFSASEVNAKNNSIHINKLTIYSLDDNLVNKETFDHKDSGRSKFARLYSAISDQEYNSVDTVKLATYSPNDIQDKEVLLELDDLLSIALMNNRMIEVARQKMAQKQGELTQAWSGYLPHLALEGRYFYTERKNSAQSSGNDYENSEVEQVVQSLDETEEDDIMHGAVNFSQLIYDFGKTTGSIGVGKSNMKAADANLQRQIQDIIFQVKVAYYNVLEKGRLIGVAEESVKSFKQHLDQAKLYLKAGIRTKIDVINAEVELSNANMNLLRSEYGLKTARVALEQVLGSKPNQGNYLIQSDEVRLDNIFETMPAVPDTLDNLIVDAMEQRPDIIQLNRLTEAANANLERVKGDYWPAIMAAATYNEYDTDLSLYKDSWEVGLSARWDLFSGLHTQGAVAEARGRLLENRAQLEDQQLIIVREVTEAYLQTDENRESVQIALQTLELTKENVLLAEKRYKSGANDVIEFNDAQLSLTKARIELVVTYFGYLTALADIEHAIGRSLPVGKKNKQAIPQEPVRQVAL